MPKRGAWAAEAIERAPFVSLPAVNMSATCSRSSPWMTHSSSCLCVFLFASQLICGCATFFHWLCAG
jgi:hypothetical protein